MAYDDYGIDGDESYEDYHERLEREADLWLDTQRDIRMGLDDDLDKPEDKPEEKPKEPIAKLKSYLKRLFG